jgi:hypothetical protein
LEVFGMDLTLKVET